MERVHRTGQRGLDRGIPDRESAAVGSSRARWATTQASASNMPSPTRSTWRGCFVEIEKGDVSAASERVREKVRIGASAPLPMSSLGRSTAVPKMPHRCWRGFGAMPAVDSDPWVEPEATQVHHREA
eukprot:SAG11_NODE_906_length_6600_cov_8.505461_5_plen_127_part_00